ncbi:MAG: cell division FtsA domain-containing protein [Candidatus Saccharibacteria bacterium]|nr:cell division FtsA domain-containing protein [Candidatus Saccharibacteria bacterium]
MSEKRDYNPDDIILSLDIGTEFVKVLIAEHQKDDSLKIIGAAKVHQEIGNMYAGAIADIPAVISTCEKALSIAEEEAGVVSRAAVVGIAGELIKGSTSTVRYRRKNSAKPITEAEMDMIISRVQESAGEKARKAVAVETGNPDVEVRLINSAIVSLTIDGYKVSNPISFKGSELVIQFYTAFAPLVHISAIEKVCAELNLDLLAVAVEPFAVCRACLGDETDSDLSAIVMDIGGGTTDVAVVDDGGVDGTKMFGIGGRSFTHQIASKLGMDFDTAESIKLNLDRELLTDPTAIAIADRISGDDYVNYLETPSRRAKIEEAVQANIDVWLSGVQIALEDFTVLEMLPHKILLCGGGAGLIKLQEALATEDWWEDLPFSRRPEVHILDDLDIPGITNATNIDLDYTYITAFGLLRVALDTMSGVEAEEGLRAKLAKLLQN